jgi:hypothetical protein
LGIGGVIYDEWPTESLIITWALFIRIAYENTYIGILCTQFGMVPECAGLIASESNIIDEGGIWGNRTSIHEWLGLFKDILAVEKDTIEVEGS